MLKYY